MDEPPWLKLATGVQGLGFRVWGLGFRAKAPRAWEFRV